MINIVRHFASASELVFPSPTSYNYDRNGDDWQLAAHVRRSQNQSPIALSSCEACKIISNKLQFINYNKTLSGPLKLINNGHTVELTIPQATDGSQLALCGCALEGVYKAQQMHFHWGSKKSKGAEHTIDSERHDAEIHIVHTNSAYHTLAEAMHAKDGFVVLGIFIRCVKQPKVEPLALNKICEETKELKDYGATLNLNANLKLEEILANLNVNEFFAYQGSLTTPPCAEAVDWFVFSNPVDVSHKYFKNFWSLEDTRGKVLLNNYRNLQDINDRRIYFCITK